MEPIRYFNRYTGREEAEMVYGEAFLKWTYANPFGRLALEAFVKRPFFSKWYGRRMSGAASKLRIAPFIQLYGIDTEEMADSPESFASFNEFFYRRLKPEARPVDPDPSSVVFPADGRHLGFERASEIDSVFVKGQRFDLPELLGDPALAARFRDGSLVLSRLCPVDYHRFHFPAAGVPGPVKTIGGQLYSVSPYALRRRLAYLWANKRTVTRLETERFGTVIVMEIGATCVGGIHQTHETGREVEKGAEKGYFEFGGSSTITLFEPGAVKLADDLLTHTARRTELYARIGDRMGTAA